MRIFDQHFIQGMKSKLDVELQKKTFYYPDDSYAEASILQKTTQIRSHLPDNESRCLRS